MAPPSMLICVGDIGPTSIIHRNIEDKVGVEDWNLWVDVGKNLVGREKIEKAVRRLMDGYDEAMEMRKQAQELGEKAKRATEEGGSSHESLTTLIEELRTYLDGGEKESEWRSVE
ncbi:hypothetical protein SO802_033960 [Lithocarpus litseifolius]|uniref:Uncharacterized protein n=1 Tax=Lithocarpus litseifolius TaxID=425828 RepID=A0AAW2BJX8_9ROSI